MTHRPSLALASGAVLALLGWPFVVVLARGNLEWSWQHGLRLALEDGLRFGQDVIWTYGPLGFLVNPAPPTGFLTALAFIVSTVVYVLVGAYVVDAARRAVPLPLALVLGLVIARTFGDLPPFEAIQVLVLIAATEILGGRWAPSPRLLPIAAGILAGALALGKLNVAVFAGAFLAIMVVGTSAFWWRGVGLMVASAIASGLAVWLILGQDVAALAGYLMGGLDIISGYSQAMGTDRDPGRHWLYAAFIVVSLLMAWALWRHTRSWPTRRRAAAIAIWLVLDFALWKIAFVRMFPAYSFASMAIVATVFLGSAGVSRRAAIVVVALPLLVFTQATSRSLPGLLAVDQSVRSAVALARDDLIPGRWDVVAQNARERLRERYRLGAGMLGELEGRTVHIDPWEIGVAFAYPGIAWDPLPVFQSYSAYTPRLDAINAERLAGPDAPARILREAPTMVQDGETVALTVDGRYRWWESPRAMLETFCRYRQIDVDDHWEVLGRTTGSCSAPERIAVVTVAFGETVTVPIEERPGRFVIARITGLVGGPLERVREALYKAPEWYALIDGERYRIVQGTVGQGVLLAVPTTADGTGSFRFNPGIRTLSIRPESIGAPSEGTVTIEFQSVAWEQGELVLP